MGSPLPDNEVGLPSNKGDFSRPLSAVRDQSQYYHCCSQQGRAPVTVSRELSQTPYFHQGKQHLQEKTR